MAFTSIKLRHDKETRKRRQDMAPCVTINRYKVGKPRIYISKKILDSLNVLYDDKIDLVVDETDATKIGIVFGGNEIKLLPAASSFKQYIGTTRLNDYIRPNTRATVVKHEITEIHGRKAIVLKWE